MTAELLAGIAGIVLSLAFSYIPGLSDWFAEFNATQKRLIMAFLMLVVAVGVFGLSCAGVVDAVACTRTGALAIVSAFVAALVANQSAYQLSPPTAKQRARQEREELTYTGSAGVTIGGSVRDSDVNTAGRDVRIR